MRFKTFFFDLDETLYPSSNGLWVEIRARITAFLRDRMGFAPDGIDALREHYFREYGTTLRGLQVNHQVDMDEYLAFVHDVPLEKYLQPNPAVRRVLEQLPGRAYIFTNADCAHADRVTRALGLEGLFAGCIDVHAIAPFCKPERGAFEKALQAAGGPEARACVLLDDQGRNTRQGRALGMYTVLVGHDSPGFEADEALESLADLPALLQNWRL